MDIFVTALFMLETALALLIGGMIFFPSVVAPTVFTVLDTAHGSAFLRALFPRYYAFITVASLLGLVSTLILPHHDIAAFVFAFVAGSTVWVMLWLVPKLNRWRDLQLEGDAVAGQKFKQGHRISVLINLSQLIALIATAVYV